MNDEWPQTRLEERLLELDGNLSGAYSRVVNVTQALLPRAYATFWPYTDHSRSHSRAVIYIIDALCTDALLRSLSADEAFTLLAGASLHDTGMVTDKPLKGHAAKEAREAHHLLGQEKIEADPESLGVPRRYASVVGKVVKHHRSSDIPVEVNDEPVGTGRGLVRLRLLCALVRAGDELHITEDRAPQIVVENLDLPDESIEHFARCKAVTGVAPSAIGSETIIVKARAHDGLMEQGLHKAVEKINRELVGLHGIFEQYDLPAYRAELRLDREQLILKKTLLSLCSCPQAQGITLISSRTAESESKVRDACTTLAAKGLICRLDGEQYAPISNDVSAFKTIASYFLETPEDMAFLETAYCQDAVRDTVFPWLREQYSCFYGGREQGTRLDVLRRSPSALAMSLSGSQVGSRPSAISRRVLLDQLLLSGMLTDLYVRPACTEGLDVGKVVGQLGRAVSGRVRDFARVISRAWQYRDIPVPEMLERLPTDGTPDNPVGKHDSMFSFSIEFPKEPIFLSPAHLMHAANEEHVSLEIGAPQLKSFRSAHEPLRRLAEEGYEVAGMKIMPNPPEPGLPPRQIGCRFTVDESQRKCTMAVNTKGELDAERSPMRLEITALEEGLRFRPVRNYAVCSCADWLEQLSLEGLLGSTDTCTVVLMDDSTGDALHTGEMVMSSDGGRLEPPEYVSAIRALASVERKLNISIEPPFYLTRDQAARIVQDEEQLACSEREEALEALRVVAAMTPLSFVSVRISVLDSAGQAIWDYHANVMPGSLNPRLTLGDGSEPDSPASGDRVTVSYPVSHSPSEVVTEFLARVGGDALCLPFHGEKPTLPFDSEVRLVIPRPEDTLWGQKHVVHLTVRPRPAHRRKLDLAKERIESDDLEGAEELLIQCIVAEPTLGLAHYNLGCLYYQMSDLNRAERSLLNFLELESRISPSWEAETHSVLGRINLHRGKLGAAMQGYERALTLDPRFDHQKAVAAIEEKLPRHINESAASYAAGWLLMKAGETDRARSHLERFLAIGAPYHASYVDAARGLLREAERQPGE